MAFQIAFYTDMQTFPWTYKNPQRKSTAIWFGETVAFNIDDYTSSFYSIDKTLWLWKHLLYSIVLQSVPSLGINQLVVKVIECHFVYFDPTWWSLLNATFPKIAQLPWKPEVFNYELRILEIPVWGWCWSVSVFVCLMHRIRMPEQFVISY